MGTESGHGGKTLTKTHRIKNGRIMSPIAGNSPSRVTFSCSYG